MPTKDPMSIFKDFIDLFFHLDKHLNYIIQSFGHWTYLLLFGIVFAETGLVVTPFLPGDSLLFAAGAISAAGGLKVWWLFIILALAAIIGDSVNYVVGKYIGLKLFAKPNSRIFKKEYLDRTHAFYEKYGGKTIILARFVPIVRTFAPFVAGAGSMSYLYFFTYNVVGGILWVAIFVFGGYYFGNMPLVKEHFSIAVFVIVILSILPGVIEFWKHHRNKRKT